MKRLDTVLVLVLSLALAGAGCAARSKSQTKGKGEQPEAAKTSQPVDVPGFGKDERAKILGWFRTHQSGLPPGLAKREQLPPGLQRHLEKNGTLPPGLQKRLQPLPGKLVVLLPRLPRGYGRYVIAGHVILVDERTATVVDIIRDVIR